MIANPNINTHSKALTYLRGRGCTVTWNTPGTYALNDDTREVCRVELADDGLTVISGELPPKRGRGGARAGAGRKRTPLSSFSMPTSEKLKLDARFSRIGVTTTNKNAKGPTAQGMREIASGRVCVLPRGVVQAAYKFLTARYAVAPGSELGQLCEALADSTAPSPKKKRTE